MTARNSFMTALPNVLYNNHKAINESDLIFKKTVTEDTIKEFEQLLNEAQPITGDDKKNRSLIQFMYRKNPTNFYRFLTRSRLSHIVLWTEAKCIVSHFGLNGLVYIKWDNTEYKCSVHRNTYNLHQDEVQKEKLREPGTTYHGNNPGVHRETRGPSRWGPRTNFEESRPNNRFSTGYLPFNNERSNNKRQFRNNRNDKYRSNNFTRDNRDSLIGRDALNADSSRSSDVVYDTRRLLKNKDTSQSTPSVLSTSSSPDVTQNRFHAFQVNDDDFPEMKSTQKVAPLKPLIDNELSDSSTDSCSASKCTSGKQDLSVSTINVPEVKVELTDLVQPVPEATKVEEVNPTEIQVPKCDPINAEATKSWTNKLVGLAKSVTN